METKTIKLTEATEDELRYQANLVMALDVNRMVGKDKLLAAIRMANPTLETIDVPDVGVPATAADAPVEPLAAGVTNDDEPLVTINIPKQDREDGDRGVPVSVNGVQIILPRDIDVDVPLRYVAALKNAISTDIRQDPKTEEFNYRPVPSYPFTIISGREHLQAIGEIR